MILTKFNQVELLRQASNNVTVELRTGHLPAVCIKGTFIKSQPHLDNPKLKDVIDSAAPNTVFEAVMLAREVANILGLSAHLVESDGNQAVRHIEQIITSEFTRNDVRAVLSNHGVHSGAMTTELVKPLRAILGKHLKQSGIYDGTAKLLRLKPNQPRFIQMKTDHWKCREAVSFNIGDGGFIGFAGWADDTNIKPILSGMLEWTYNHNVKLKA